MLRFVTFAVVSTLAAAGAAYAVPAGSGTSAKASVSRDTIICRRFVRTGSLVDGYRACKTRAEWDREQDHVRQFGLSDSCGRRGEDSVGCNQ